MDVELFKRLPDDIWRYIYKQHFLYRDVAKKLSKFAQSKENVHYYESLPINIGNIRIGTDIYAIKYEFKLSEVLKNLEKLIKSKDHKTYHYQIYKIRNDLFVSKYSMTCNILCLFIALGVDESIWHTKEFMDNIPNLYEKYYNLDNYDIVECSWLTNYLDEKYNWYQRKRKQEQVQKYYDNSCNIM